MTSFSSNLTTTAFLAFIFVGSFVSVELDLLLTSERMSFPLSDLSFVDVFSLVSVDFDLLPSEPLELVPFTVEEVPLADGLPLVSVDFDRLELFGSFPVATVTFVELLLVVTSSAFI